MNLRSFARITRIGLLMVLAAPPGPARAAGVISPDSLYASALRDIRKDKIEARRRAMKTLEKAVQLAPDSVAYQLELGRLYFRMGFLGQARRRFEYVTRLRPDLAEAHLGQGLAWRRDYLKYLEPGSLRRALEELREAARIAPGWSEPWLQMVPLLVEDARLGEALSAAERVRSADPSRVDGVLAVANVAYRLGQVQRADSLFRQALPRLQRPVLEKFLDIAPLVTEADTARLSRMPRLEQMEFAERFWKDVDPDLASEENEARIEYWSRVTQAYFLYYNTRRQVWDQRGEVYVRYGPPRRTIYNPVGADLYHRMGFYGNFPMNMLIWEYPDLGMVVPMHDRLLSEFYLPPVSVKESTDPLPLPEALASHPGSLPTASGRGVFSRLPPGTRPLPLDAVLARFEGESQPRLLAWLQSPGAPDDTLWGEWVVLDASRAEVARVRRPLGLSACDPGELKATEFANDLPPGEYLAGLTVRSSRGPARKGVFRTTVHLGAPRRSLALSDVVVSCESPGTALSPVGEAAVRLTASPGARINGSGPLTVYFEAYHLQTGPDGMSRFEYEYVVESAETDPRFWIQRLLAPRPALPDIAATRRESNLGDLRRQFVTIPIASLPAGYYQVRITVRDLLSGDQAVRIAMFQREPTARGGSGS